MTSIIPFETSKCRGLFVVVPEWAKDFRAHKSKLWLFKGRDIIASDSIDIPEGNWQILGLLNEVSEEHAAEVVAFDNDSNYRDYLCRDYQLRKATDSLRSLARSLNVPENSVVLIEKK